MKEFDPKRLAQKAAETYSSRPVEPVTAEWVYRIVELVAERLAEHPKVRGMMDLPVAMGADREIRAHTEHLRSATPATLHCHPDEEKRLVAEIAGELYSKWHKTKNLKNVYPYVVLQVVAEEGTGLIRFNTRYGKEHYICDGCKKQFDPAKGPLCQPCYEATKPKARLSDDAAKFLLNEILGASPTPYRPQSGDVLFFINDTIMPHSQLQHMTEALEDRLSEGLNDRVRVIILPKGMKPVGFMPEDFIECPSCRLRSYHPKDIEHKFCCKCGYHSD